MSDTLPGRRGYVFPVDISEGERLHWLVTQAETDAEREAAACAFASWCLDRREAEEERRRDAMCTVREEVEG